MPAYRPRGPWGLIRSTSGAPSTKKMMSITLARVCGRSDAAPVFEIEGRDSMLLDRFGVIPVEGADPCQGAFPKRVDTEPRLEVRVEGGDRAEHSEHDLRD